MTAPAATPAHQLETGAARALADTIRELRDHAHYLAAMEQAAPTESVRDFYAAKRACIEYAQQIINQAIAATFATTN